MKISVKKHVLEISLLVVASVAVLCSIKPATYLLRKWHFSSTVQFSADFESGSLGRAQLIGFTKAKIQWRLSYLMESRLDPPNPADSTMMPGSRWFYFRMTGVKNKEIQLLFRDTDSERPVYSYDNCSFQRFSEWECGAQSISKRFNRDTVYIAYSFPYTFSRIQQQLSGWGNNNCVQIDTIGWSEQGRPLQQMTITDFSVPEEHKKRIYLHSRIHPGETPAAWLLEGFIQTLLSEGPKTEHCRKTMIFHILPCANPDGVVGGYSRANANGINLEENFQSTEILTALEARAIKQHIIQLSKNRPLDLVLNLHSHVAPQVSYWIHTALSTSTSFYYKQLHLAHATIQNTSYCSEGDLLYSHLPKSCIEGWIWKLFRDQTLALCFETPYSRYGIDPQSEWVTEDNLQVLGKDLLHGIADYLQSAPNLHQKHRAYPDGVQRLVLAYPGYVIGYSGGNLLFKDGSSLLFDDYRQKTSSKLLDSADIQDMFAFPYPKGILDTSASPTQDPGRIRNELFFQKMYGYTEHDVIQRLTSITWCPQLVEKKLSITRINDVHKQLQKISRELDSYPEWAAYLLSAATYNRRNISGTQRLSTHSFGIALDLNTTHSNYWKWDYPEAEEDSDIGYKNQIPQEIVAIFEKYGFIWGGKWRHYDTMHFEYRPELLVEPS